MKFNLIELVINNNVVLFWN